MRRPAATRARVGGLLLMAIAMAGCSAGPTTTGGTSTAASAATAPATTVPAQLPPAYLAEAKPVEGNVPTNGDVHINGKDYPHSVVQPSYIAPGNVTQTQYDLGRRCDRLTFTAGLTDDSTSGGTIQFDVFGDDRPLLSVRLDFGHDSTQSVDVSQVLRLKLQNSGIKGTGNLRAGWGTAAIICHA